MYLHLCYLSFQLIYSQLKAKLLIVDLGQPRFVRLSFAGRGTCVTFVSLLQILILLLQIIVVLRLAAKVLDLGVEVAD